jgi:hypothetical protein
MTVGICEMPPQILASLMVVAQKGFCHPAEVFRRTGSYEFRPGLAELR